MMPVCSIVTEKTISEFKLLMFSMEQYHDNIRWFISCDDAALDVFKNEQNVIAVKMIDSDDCDHNLQDAGKRDRWMKVMMTKFAICRKALKHSQGLPVIFLDCDMVFVGPIEPRIISLSSMEQIDAMVCQHMTNNWANEAKHGYFNAGMFVIRSKEFLVEWENLSKHYKEFNLYFEQKPLEFIQRNFVTLNLPINYDIGWWRFNEQNTVGRLKSLRLLEDKEGEKQIWFGNRRAVNFHAHMLRSLETKNFGQFLVDKIEMLLESGSDNDKYKELLAYYRFLKEG